MVMMVMVMMVVVMMVVVIITVIGIGVLVVLRGSHRRLLTHRLIGAQLLDRVDYRSEQLGITPGGRRL